jgi:ring-1,2-phenylacetyl-CoA epoxidase subunit PaaD
MNYSKEQIFELLNEVKDPEIPTISVVELGVVRQAIIENEKVRVVITPTYSGCPALQTMQDDILAKLKEHGIGAEIEVQLSPPWTTDWMDENAKQKLLDSQIAPPIGNATDVNKLFKVVSPNPHVDCPWCGSNNTDIISEFGTTACKALYKCRSCGQPFDYFKPH